jgi:hypothetical protein
MCFQINFESRILRVVFFWWGGVPQLNSLAIQGDKVGLYIQSKEGLLSVISSREKQGFQEQEAQKDCLEKDNLAPRYANDSMLGKQLSVFWS